MQLEIYLARVGADGHRARERKRSRKRPRKRAVSNRIQTALRGRADKIGTAAPIERSLSFLPSNKVLKNTLTSSSLPIKLVVWLTHRVATTIAYSLPLHHNPRGPFSLRDLFFIQGALA